jgi:hypothetical protein
VGTYSGGQFANYWAPSGGENIVRGSSSIDPYYDMEMWMASSGHKANIQKTTNVELGTGSYKASTEAFGVQNFGGGFTRDIDISISASDISFAPTNPGVGDTLKVMAKIVNIGGNDAYPITVKIFEGDPGSGGVQRGNTMHVPIIFINGDTVTVSISFTTVGWTQGTHTIYVLATAEYPCDEIKTADNQASKTISIGTSNTPEIGLILVSITGIMTIATIAHLAIRKTRYH